MRDPERMRDPPRAEHRLGRAAAALPVGALVRPELEGDRDDLMAGVSLSERGDGRVDPAAEGDEDPLPTVGRRLGERSPGPREARERAVKRVRRENGSVAMAGPQGRRARLRSRRARSAPPRAPAAPRPAPQWPPPRPQVAAHPSVIERDPLDPAAGRGEREANEVAAGRATGRSAEGAVGRGPAPRIVGEVLL